MANDAATMIKASHSATVAAATHRAMFMSNVWAAKAPTAAKTALTLAASQGKTGSTLTFSYSLAFRAKALVMASAKSEAPPAVRMGVIDQRVCVRSDDMSGNAKRVFWKLSSHSC